MSETTEPVLGQSTRMGRPPKLTSVEREEVYSALLSYIVEEEDPTLVGFCAWNNIAIEYNITKDNLYDWDDFSELRKRAVEKQEAYLVKQAGAGKYNPAIAIFRLKQPQHGYRDRQEITGAEGKDLIPAQELSPTQAAQLLTLRLERDASDTSTD